jgi:hypothetical protein
MGYSGFLHPCYLESGPMIYQERHHLPIWFAKSDKD